MPDQTQKLSGKCVALLAVDGFEESEFTKPKKALEEAGAKVDVISLKPGSIKSWTAKNWGQDFEVNRTLDEVKPGEYDSLLLPGGVINADKLRTDPKAVEFVAEFARTGKPIAAICHAPWILIEVGTVAGRRMTSWPSLKTDLENAGAEWSDEKVVVDNGIVTSRKPDDIPDFNAKMIEEFCEGVHSRAAS